jgi:hypothetical protein
MGWQPNYQTEARIYAAYILKNHPGKTMACSIRTTISARITSSACARGSANGPAS